MSEQVGQIYYDVTLDTGKLLVEVRVVTDQLQKVAKEGDKLDAKFNALATAAKIFATALATVKVAEFADDLRLMAARVQVAAGSLDSGVTAMAALIAMSKATSTAVSANVEVFTKLNQSILAMGGNQNDTLRVTELLGKAIKVSGASATEAKAAMLQFGQALGSGRLQGDEFRSLMENAPYLMQKLATGLGVPIGALKALSTQGKLTSDVIVNALGKAAEQINSDFAKFPQTVAGAFQVAMDAAERANEKLDQLTGTSTALTGIGKGLGDVLDKLAEEFGAANDEAGKLGRNTAIKGWADQTKIVLSYVVDAADMAWQTLSVLGRNVAFVFTGIGKEIGGIGAQIAAVMTGDFAGAKAIGDAMTADSEQRRATLDAADAKTLAKRKLFGEQMREAWEQGNGGGRGTVNPQSSPSKLKPTAVDDKEARQLAARAAAAQAYYEGLVADNATALAKIDAEERKALAENHKRAALDKNNQDIYAKARVEIATKFNKQRALLEERTTREVADLHIAITTDQDAKISTIETEAIRRADAAEKLKTMTHGEAERAKTLATFQAEQARKAILEGVAQTNAETAIEWTVDEMTKIDLVRQEGIRRANAAAGAGAISYAQAEANKVKATADAQAAIREKILSIDPVAALAAEYEQKLSIVKTYENAMAQAGVDGAKFVEEKRAQLSEQYRLQRLALAEQEFTQQGASNKLLMDSLNGMANSATTAITGLITGTATASDLMRGLANVVLNETVGALVQVGLQYVKNAIVGVTAEKALAASKAANGIAYAAAISAQIAVNTSLAAQGAFAATAAIPLIGPELAPAAAAAAGAAAAAFGAPAAAAAPLAGARRYGGPAAAGSMYRVNESGAPEMFTAANGSQYMLPTASGQVTSAGDGSSVQWTININNTAAGTQATASVDQSSKTVEIAVATVASQIRSNSGPVWSAMTGATNVRSAGL